MKTVPPMKKKKIDWGKIDPGSLTAALNWDKMAPGGYQSYGTKDFTSTDLIVVKESGDSGLYRWVLFSSNAFEDRDTEVISLAALKADIDRTDIDGNYGPLRWWHVGSPDPRTLSPGPGLDIGSCDYSGLHGRILIESGTFNDPKVARKVARQAPNLHVSLGFFHPASQPDNEGVFQNIHRFERSLLPKGRASNPYTAIPVITGKESVMIKEKIDALKKVLGGDDETVQLILDAAEKQEAIAEAAKARTKESAEALPEATAKDGEEKTEEIEETGDETPDEIDLESLGGPFVGDMAPEEFAGLLVDAMSRALAPFAEVVKSLETGAKAKDDTIASLKEATKDLVTQITTLSSRVGDLEGGSPKMLKGYRASQDTETVATKTEKEPTKPGWDPEFTTFLVGQ